MVVNSGKKRSALAEEAAEAARRYATDEEFAFEFGKALQEFYETQLARLERIAQTAQMGLGRTLPSIAVQPPKPAAEPAPAALITPDQVREAIRAGGSHGTTRGEIATRVGVDSRDLRLTRILRLLKTDNTITQTGDRRSARYFLVSTRKR